MHVQRIGIIHPGQMGVSVAAAAGQGGHDVRWASEGRSTETRERAAEHGLNDAHTLKELCASCSIIMSVCPPHAAETVMDEVLAHGFTGLYLDANAIAPQRSARMSRAVTAAGGAFVDGGIIGGPAWKPGTTVLYLSGPRADEIAACFTGSPLAARVLGAEIGTASALKMCYAAYSKGAAALAAAILATAEQLGVRDALMEQWNDDEAGFADAMGSRTQRVTAKAWRYVGEMKEIAATFRAAGLPGDFHEGAADVYRRMAAFKGAAVVPALEDVLAALAAGEGEEIPAR